MFACLKKSDVPHANARVHGHDARVGARASLILAVFLAACSAPATPVSAPGTSPVVRVYDTRASAMVSFDQMVRTAARADLVFFGEQHDDPVTHATELAFLAAIAERRPNVVLSLEMFERDVQTLLDRYLAGQIGEPEFLAASRPWDRYNTDYRGMVELARARGWPVVASNIPRRVASMLGRGGLAILDTLSATEKQWTAREHQCPRGDEYFRRFAEQMQGHGPGGPASPSDTAGLGRMTERFYDAQCAKDEAMAEAMVAYWQRAGRDAIAVHYDGAFHSDYGLGTAARARRRAAAARTVVISAVPVASLDSLPIAEHRGKGDYLVFTRRVPAPAK